MSFKIPDLIVESVIRDGLEVVRRNPSIIDEIYGELKKLGPLMTEKYGDRELNKIKEYFQNNEISIVQAFSQVVDNIPAISIQLIENTENTSRAYLGDFEEDTVEDITDPDELAALVIESGISLTAYDSNSGQVLIADSANLANVTTGKLLEDVDGNEFKIVGGINNTTGDKQVFIQPGSNLNISGPAKIKSSIDFRQFETQGNNEDERILIGLHTEERLLTIYLYILVKYFLNSRKKDLIDRGFQLSTYSGSDFTRALEYKEPVFSRFITLSGMIQNSWSADKATPIENIDLEVLVEKDEAGNENFTDSTIQVTDDENS